MFQKLPIGMMGILPKQFLRGKGIHISCILKTEVTILKLKLAGWGSTHWGAYKHMFIGCAWTFPRNFVYASDSCSSKGR